MACRCNKHLMNTGRAYNDVAIGLPKNIQLETAESGIGII
jgi:hypothetical protein